MPAFHQFQSKESLYSSASLQIAKSLSHALVRRDTATLLLSGGTTPAPVYSRLSETELDWSRIHVGLVDERWVDASHEASNALLIRTHLLKAKAALAQFTPMKTEHSTAAEAADTVDEAYAEFKSPDVVVLGMGNDGHCASWFPESSNLGDAMSLTTRHTVISISAEGSSVAGKYTDRMTITLPVVKAAKSVLLLITGAEKRRVLEQTSLQLPIHHALSASPQTEVFWAP